MTQYYYDMNLKSAESGLILLGTLLITVFILPLWSYDPVSAPKLWGLTTVAGVALGISLTRHQEFKLKNFTLFEKAVLGFSLIAIVNLAANHVAISERIFGIRGRSTGLLALLAFAVIAFLFARNRFSTQFFVFMLIGNISVCLYFVLQIIGLDPFSVENFYSAPSSTLGNPNFVSGFAGFSVLSTFFFYKKANLNSKLALIAIFFLNLFVFIKSQSIQGVIALALGIGIYLLLELLTNQKAKWFYLASMLFSSLGLLAVFGFAGKGPLANLLQSSTVFSRLDYWRSAWRMTIDNPWFGVGLDGYGDSYRKYRDLQALNRFGAGQTADSAHNVFLDMFANGGLPLGTAFLLISVIPALVLLQKLRSTKKSDSTSITLLAIWSAFQLQAFVSVNQIGVSVWGWALLGAMVAYARKEEAPIKNILTEKPKTKRIPILIGTCVMGLSPLLALPVLVSEIRFLQYANSADGVALDKLVNSWPRDSRRMNFIARGWINSNDPVRAKTLLLKSVDWNPDYYANWELILSLPNISSAEAERSRQQLKLLDPLVVPQK